LSRHEIRVLRIILGLTRKQFASKVGISTDLVYAIESGRRSITKRTLFRIENRFDRKITELVKQVTAQMSE